MYFGDDAPGTDEVRVRDDDAPKTLSPVSMRTVFLTKHFTVQS